MASESVEIVRRMPDEARQDPEALFEMLADEVEWKTGELSFRVGPRATAMTE